MGFLGISTRPQNMSFLKGCVEQCCHVHCKTEFYNLRRTLERILKKMLRIQQKNGQRQVIGNYVCDVGHSRIRSSQASTGTLYVKMRHLKGLALVVNIFFRYIGG